MNDDSSGQRYQEAIAYLHGRINYERRAPVPYEARYFKLDRMRRLLRQLGDPQLASSPLHIAGSKGKGSVAAMIAAATAAAGYRTGLFTSPHLERLEERFSVDSQPCRAAELVALVEEVRPAVEQLDAESGSPWERPTFFEIVTAVAMLHFQRRQVEACVLEVGLGGRLDATNVCHPSVCVITTISRDHTQQLGDSPAQIAREKAGIIKPGVPVVTGVTEPESLTVIEQACRQRKAPLWRLGREFHAEATSTGPDGTRLVYRDDRVSIPCHVPLAGLHQARNAAVALAALRVWIGVAQQGRDVAEGVSLPTGAEWSVDEGGLEAAMVEGIERVVCPARVEILRADPPIVLDVAHNDASVAALQQTLGESCPGRRWVVVFGTSTDKDAPAMLARLTGWAEHLLLTQYRSNPRAAAPARLADQLPQRLGCQSARVDQILDPQEAWQRALELAAPDAGICVLGSFFLAAELRATMVRFLGATSEPTTGWTQAPLE